MYGNGESVIISVGNTREFYSTVPVDQNLHVETVIISGFILHNYPTQLPNTMYSTTNTNGSAETENMQPINYLTPQSNLLR